MEEKDVLYFARPLEELKVYDVEIRHEEIEGKKVEVIEKKFKKRYVVKNKNTPNILELDENFRED